MGIHVRRSQFGEGDFEKYMQSRSEGGFYLSKAYFKTAMNYFRTKFSKKVIFIVSSDDQDWCIRNLKVNNFIDHPAMFGLNVSPSITDGVHQKENFVEIIPVFSTFSKIFNNKKKKFFIKAILCNFSMRLLKYF